MLGVNVPDPGYLPSGWTLGSRTIRGWPAGYFGRAEAVSDFNEYWILPGSGPDSGAKITRLIELEVHLASQGTDSLPGWRTIALGSGAEATGLLEDGSVHLVWTYQGMGLKVTTYGISAQESLRFINALEFPSS